MISIVQKIYYIVCCVCVCVCVCVSTVQEAREKSAGKGWYEIEAPQMTPELQNDLKLLRMRNALDPSQHYKGSDWKRLPRYFQVLWKMTCIAYTDSANSQ